MRRSLVVVFAFIALSMLGRAAPGDCISTAWLSHHLDVPAVQHDAVLEFANAINESIGCSDEFASWICPCEGEEKRAMPSDDYDDFVKAKEDGADCAADCLPGYERATWFAGGPDPSCDADCYPEMRHGSPVTFRTDEPIPDCELLTGAGEQADGSSEWRCTCLPCAVREEGGVPVKVTADPPTDEERDP